MHVGNEKELFHSPLYAPVSSLRLGRRVEKLQKKPSLKILRVQFKIYAQIHQSDVDF